MARKKADDVSAEFIQEMLGVLDNEWASVATDGVTVGDITGYVDTGSYAFNALVSGSIYGGIPENKIVNLCGEYSTGKTYYSLTIAKSWLDSMPGSVVLYFHSEGAITKEQLVARGIDLSRFVQIPVDTVSEFRTQAFRVVDRYLENKCKGPRVMVILDSLGNLSTTKETTDIKEGNSTTDMTRAKEIRGAFRVLTSKWAKARIPVILTNHIYTTIGFISQKKQGGGCLVAGTMVQMADGSKKPIETIKLGESVQTMVGPHRVTETYTYHNEAVTRLKTPMGDIVATDEHRFMVDNKWTTVTDIIEDVMTKKSVWLQGYDSGQYWDRKVTGFTAQVEKQTVYDIQVETAHHYIIEDGIVSHNSGPEYAGSAIIFLSKKQDKDGDETRGAIITCKTDKSRITVEKRKVLTRLDFKTGLDRYYGLLDLAVKFGIVKKMATKYTFPASEESVTESQVDRNPTRFYTKEILDQIDAACKEEFIYGSTKALIDREDDEEAKAA